MEMDGNLKKTANVLTSSMQCIKEELPKPDYNLFFLVEIP